MTSIFKLRFTNPSYSIQKHFIHYCNNNLISYTLEIQLLPTEVQIDPLSTLFVFHPNEFIFYPEQIDI